MRLVINAEKKITVVDETKLSGRIYCDRNGDDGDNG